MAKTQCCTPKLNPETFFAVCARLIPRDVELTVRQTYSVDLDPADFEILRAIKAATQMRAIASQARYSTPCWKHCEPRARRD